MTAACLRAFEDSPDFLLQGGNVDLNDSPDDVEIDAEVIVDQPIPHACHRTPLHVGIGIANLSRNTLRRLANHFQTADDRPLKHRIVFQSLASQRLANPVEKLGLNQDVPKNVTRLVRYPRRQQECGGA